MRTRLIVALGALVLLVAGGYLFVRHALGTDLVRVQIERQLAARLGQPVHIRSASASIVPVAVELHDLTIGEPPTVQLARVRIVTGARALFSRRVEDAELVIENGRIAWPLPFSPAGAASATAPGSGPSPLTIVSVKRSQGRNVTLVTSLPPIVVDLDAALVGDRLEISRLDARSDRNRVEASGAFTSLSRLEGSFRAKGELTVAGYTARGFGATVAISPRGIALSSLTFAMFGGTFDGGLDVDLRRAVPQLQLKGSVAAVDVSEVMKDTTSPGTITGRLAGTLALTAIGGDGSTLLHSARGSFRANVTNGRLPYLDIVRPVVLAFGKPSGSTPEGTGSSFSSLSGNFALANRTLTTENLVLEARDFTARGGAVLHVDTGSVDSRLDVILSQELTAQAGTDLRRYAGENGRVIVPATIGGTLAHPTVFVDPAAAIRRAVGNELKRRAGSFLEGLFKKKKGGG